MGFTNRLVKAGYNQAKNLYNLAAKHPLAPTPLGSMTLEHDDMELALSWIRRLEAGEQDDEGLIERFESEFAEWNGSRFAFSFNAGRSALSACIQAMELQPGDEVLLPGYTCVVVPNAFRYAGVVPVFCDIELDTYGLDVGQLEAKLTSKTKVILIHHLYGLVARDYEATLAFAERHGLRVIEDCAHATGAMLGDRKVGNLGHLAFYSSEQSKVFNTTMGGIAVTNDDQLAENLHRAQRLAAFPPQAFVLDQLYTVLLNYYQFKHTDRWWRGDWINLQYGQRRLISTTAEEEQGIKPTGYGYRMPPSIAALGSNQLKKLERFNQLRRENVKRWDQWCEQRGYKKPTVVENSTPVFLRYPVMVDPETKARPRRLEEELGVKIGVWFTSNVHPAPVELPDCPNANFAVRHCINLPGLM